jgi:hypothetical protein
MRIGDALVPARLLLYEHTAGLAKTQVVATCVALGLAEKLAEGPQTLARLAEAAAVPPEALSRFLRVAAAMGLVRKRRGRFVSTRQTRALHPAARGTMAPFATYMASDGNVRAWSQLTQVVRTGEDAFTAQHSRNVWAWLAEHPDDEAVFAAAMAALAQAEAPMVARAYPFDQFACLCDVGGGQGALLTAILQQHRTLRGMLFDSDSVVGAAAPHVRTSAVAPRLTLHAGDFFEAVPPGADAYLLRHVLHDWPDAACRRILGNCRRAMQPGHRLLLLDTQLEPGSADPLGAMKDLTMAVVCGGQERGRQQMQALLQACGFRLLRICRLPASVALWEAQAV